MLAKRIIPCLDVKLGKVVKGIQFTKHKIVGDIIALATFYKQSGADELVFYDIMASSEGNIVDKAWVAAVGSCLDIPFCVAGGIRSEFDAEKLLNAGADKISINSPALENPDLINKLAKTFGSQCVVIGIDSLRVDGQYRACQYTGSSEKMRITERLTADWVIEVQERGAGEIVLNCMEQDGVRDGYAISQLHQLRSLIKVPLIASGGAGKKEHFLQVFSEANVDGALAASVFHSGEIIISDLKQYLKTSGVVVRN